MSKKADKEESPLLNETVVPSPAPVIEGEVLPPAPEQAGPTDLAIRGQPPETVPVVYNAVRAARDWPQLLQLAVALFQSKIGVPAALKTPEQVATVLLAGNEYDMGPMESLQKLHVVNGKVGMDASEMRSRIYSRIKGATIEILELTDDCCRLRGCRPGKPPMEAEFTSEQAKTAALLGKDNWKNYRQDMLIARATSRLARRLFPDAFRGGVYTPDELDEPEPGVPPDASPDALTAPTRGERATTPAHHPKVVENGSADAPQDDTIAASRKALIANFREKRSDPDPDCRHFTQWVIDQTAGEVNPMDRNSWTSELIAKLEALLK